MSQQATVSPQTAFDQGVTAYASGDYATALSLFSSIQQSGITSADLERNLSKSYFKTGKLVEALTHAQNAVYLDRWNRQARHDLQIMQKALPSGYGEVLDHPAELSWKVESYVRGNEALFLGVLLVFLALLNSLLTRSLRGRMSIALMGAGVMFLLASAATLPSKSLALVVKESELRSTPITSAEAVMKVPAGARVRIRQDNSGFVEIERPNGFRGWVARDAVRPLLAE